MSEANLEALRRLYQDWAAGDMSDVSLFDPYAVAVNPDPHPVPFYGLEAVETYWRRFLDSWVDLRFEAEQYRAAGDTILVRVRRSGTGKASGIRIDDHAFHVWTFRGGKVVRFEVIEQEPDALKAAGLRE